MGKVLLHLTIAIMLTVISQLGGLAWLVALLFKRRLLAFVAAYFALSLSALVVAPQFGREPLPCLNGGPLQMQSKMYCALNRQYVVPELADALWDIASQMDSDFPDTRTIVLDANFPFLTGFPLLPHLSHNDGRKVDIAYYYRENGEYLNGTTRSPVGYFAFENGPTDCPKRIPTLRWDLTWLQPFWSNFDVDPQRAAAVLRFLAADNRIAKIFTEPHLRRCFGVQSPKIRFQGCRAARHDDHIHVQL